VTTVFERPLFARARRLCLALPETTEQASWGHPGFRAGKKTFCAFEIISGRPSIAFRLPRPRVSEVQRRKRFFATPYGRGLWVSLWMDGAVDWTLVARLVEESYRSVALTRMLKRLDAASSE
jgi:predicted DNA-binding protein (MmcQ/YjbR family)